MTSYKPLKNKVQYVLSKYGELTDRELLIAIIKEFYSHKMSGEYVHLEDVPELPSFNQVKNARRERVKKTTVKDYRPWYA